MKNLILNLDDKLFYFAFSMVIFYLFFTPFKLFFWCSYFLFGFLFTKNFKEIKNNLLELQKKEFLVLFLFLFCLFVSSFYSLNSYYSFKFFFENYVFCVLFFGYTIFWIFKNSSKIKILLQIYLFIYLLFVFIMLFNVFLFCGTNYRCITNSFIDISFYNDSILRNPLIIIHSAIMLALIFSLILYLIEAKIFYLVLFLITLILITFLSRRSILLGLFLGSFFVLFYLSFQKELNKQFLNKIKLLLVLLSFFFISLGGFLIFSERGREHFLGRDKLLSSGELVCEKEKAGSMGQRICSWIPQIKFLVYNNTFIGSGIGRKVQKQYLIKHNLDPMGIGNPHNTYINIWMQAGFQSLIVFLVFLIITLKKTTALVKTQNFITQAVGIGLIMAWVGFMVLMNFFGIEEGPRFIPFWLTAGIIWGYAIKIKYEKTS